MIFCSFENGSTRIVEAFSKRKAPDVNANFCIFESQCPKIMVLSKALKAKLSSIPSSVTDLSTPGLNLRTTMEKTATAVTGPYSTTRCGDHSRARKAPLGGPSRMILHMVCAELRVFSLLVKEGRSTFGFMAGIGAKF